jgi:GAF domain-containing protein
VFGASAASLCLLDAASDELVYIAAWGAGAREIAGTRLPSRTGIAGAVVRSGVGEAVADCRTDARFAASLAAGTGYVPHTMLVVPLMRDEHAIGALTMLDRRDGRPYARDDIEPGVLFAELAARLLDALT